MRILKSSRHSKITGDFAEGLVLYFLSKYGFECARVDHTGIDLIARNPRTKDLWGISVKSRCRVPGTESNCININRKDIDKARAACIAFKCTPYVAIVIDAANTIRVFLTSLDHLLEIFPPLKKASNWQVSRDWLARHRDDRKIMMLEFELTNAKW
jgi:hypothetical protein